MNSTLRIKVTGERLRSLISLRLKEYDRNIERVSQAVKLAQTELDTSDVEIRKQVEKAMARVASPGLMGRNDYESVGFSTVMSAKQQVERYTNTLAGLQNFRAQTLWVSESLNPSDTYELSGDDLVVLGIGTGVGMLRGIFDPLEA